MNKSWIVSSEKLSTKTLGEQCASCTHCAFAGSDLTDATPGGFALVNGALTAGDWKKAMLRRDGVVADSEPLQRRNVNDFIRHVPVGVLTKGTRLLHVTREADWVTRQMVGGHVEDDYSFFTLENKGRAGTHGNDFRRVVQLTLMQDVHCFFAGSYAFKYWRPVQERLRSGKTQTVIDDGAPHVGGDLKHMILNSWPAKYRPAAWASCSECELAFHNSVIPKIMRVASIGVLGDERTAARPHVPLHEIAVIGAEGDKHKGIAAPWWMNPHFHNRKKIAQAEERWRRRNIAIDEAESLFK
ncbi:hypothetical protein PQQ53_24500 [Paraburkholderia strydomiana]|jgi:hypothetical protein|uniref:hypothetical protein n=1 Tax=Paraburkholderia strydomiana TaxID=1245417 RepID=UPI0038B8237D